MTELVGRVAVVTGGGSGIGRATAHALARTGSAVVVADIDEDRAQAVAGEITEAGGQALGLRCDVSEDDDVAMLRNRAIEEFGRVDVVMSNVGVLALGLPENIPVEAWERIIDVNLLSVVRAVRTFLPGLLEQGSGHLVHTASTAGLYGYSYDRLPYVATKSAIVLLSECLALYTKPRGVGVTCLCPGPVMTNIAEHIEVFGPIAGPRTPELAPLDPDTVGQLAVDAILEDRFFVPTHPEVTDILIARARHVDEFVFEQARRLSGDA
ncbi:MAG TPA: SDR family oxidoreductase [Acidimicrobiales bacterium]|nr:SDR family oxidoreductase [Acidimicrobiales bacterium]